MTAVCFRATLHRPGGADAGADWAFLQLPIEASEPMPARGMVAVEGEVNGSPVLTVLNPDGQGGHWMKLPNDFLSKAKIKPGEEIQLSLAPTKKDIEPEVPADFQAALNASPPKAQETWKATTAAARRDWVAWIISGKKAETRVKRIEVAISKMTAGSKRPCCFDRSGMYSKEFSSPVSDN